MSSMNTSSGRSVRGLLSRAERFAFGECHGLGRVGGWTAALSGALVAAVCSPAMAGPEGATVVRGNVNISRNGAETLIRASHNSIINYRSFDIARGETVRFLQPNSQSRVLNRIDSRLPTRIDGSLIANGRVYLINPAGVMFGQGSVINVNQMYAAAGNLSDKDFVRGIDRFTNLKGEVSNYGTLTANYVALVGDRVANQGAIVAPQGTVVMASGDEVLVGEKNGNVFLKINGEAGKGAAAGSAATENAGTISAKGGRVAMGAGDVIGMAVRHTGTTTAKKVTLEGQGTGEVRASGTIDATNTRGKGGEVKVLGENVALSGATIDASGSSGGGTVLVGGNFQGQGAERTATKTFVTGDSTIRADATDKGHGGKVIVWADQVTRYYGEISATGGANGGNGGFAEVSGKEFLVFRGGADLGAAKGSVGDLLLDPRDITVQNTGADDGLMADNIVNFNEPDTTTDITLSDEVLEVNANVTLQADRNIIVNQAVLNTNAGRSITFFAGNDITINASITTRGGAIALTAGNRGDGNGTATGSITVGADLDTTNNGDTGGNITLTSGASGSINLNADLTVRSGTITLTGPVAVSGARTVDTGDGNGNNTGAISFSGAITGNGGDTLSVVAGNGTGRSAVTFSSAISGLDGLTVTNASTISSNGIGTTAGGNVSVNHNGTHTVNGTINIGGTYTQAGGGGTTFAGGTGITTSNDNVTFANTVTTSVNTEFSVGTGTIDLNGAVALGASTTLTLTSDSDVQLDGGANSITGPGNLTLRPGSAIETRLSGAAPGGGRLDINTGDLSAIASSVGLVTIGSSALDAAVNINAAATFAAPTTFITGGVINASADITVNSGALRLHGGFDGGADAGGSVRFGAASVDLQAATVELIAGSGAGTSFIDALTNAPSFRAAAGGATRPTSFTYQQDASIVDADIPAAAQFGAAFAGMGYTITSSAGDVTLSTASKVANSALVISGGTVNINATIAPFGTTITGTTGINLGGSITTAGSGAGAAIQLNGNVVLGTSVSLTTNTAAAGANVGITGSVSGTTDATESLTIHAGTGGAVTLGGAVGTGVLRLDAFTITNSGTTSASAGIFAVTMNATAVTSATYSGVLNATSGGITLSAPTLNVNAGATTTSGGVFTATSGTAMTIGGNLTLDGAFTKNGAGTVSLGGNIVTTGDAIDFNGGNITLTTNVLLDTTNGGGSAGGAAVESAGTVNGAFNLVVRGGTTGAILFSSAVGNTTGLTLFQVDNGDTLSAGAVTASTVDVTTTTSATFGGLITALAGGIDVTSATINFNGGATTTGAITLDAATAFNATGGNIAGATGFTKSGAGLSSVGVNISTTNSALTFSAGSLLFTGASTLSAGTNTLTMQAADINGQNVVFLANDFDLAGGFGSVTGDGTGTLRIAGATTGTTLGIAGGAGTAQFDASDVVALADGVAGLITFGGGGQTANITIASTGFQDDVLFSTTGTVFTTGAVSGNDIGSDLSFTAGTVSLGGNLLTLGGDISITGNTVLTTDVAMDTTLAAQPGGHITLTGNLSGTAGGATESINFIAGVTGDVTVTGASGTDLSLFRITAARLALLGSVNATTIDITTSGTGTNTFGAMTATTMIVDTNAGGTATFNGLLTGGSGGITILGGTVNLNAGATTTSNGIFDITTASTFTIGAVALNLDGTFTKSGAGNCVIAGDLTTTNDAITFNSTATVGAANVTLTAGTAGIFFNSTLGLGGNNLTLLANAIDFGGANSVTGTGAGTLRFGGATNATTIGVGTGAGTLSLDATDLAALANQAAAVIAFGRTGQTGNIDIGGATFLDAMSANSTGTIFVTGTGIVGSNADSSVSLIGGLVNLGADIQTSGGAINLFGPVTLSGASPTLDTTGAGTVTTGGNITITGDVNSTAAFTNTLNIFAGSDGDVSLQDVGTGTALGGLLIFESDEVTAGAVTAGSIGVVVDNLGTYNGLLTGNGGVGFGIILTGSGAHTVNAGATTTNGGAFTASCGGLLTINAALTLDGAFVRNGGLTTLGADISTTNDAITFTDGDDDVTLSASGLTLTSGTATITFGGDLAAGANSLTLRGNGIDFNGGANTVTGTGTGTLTLVGATNATSIGVGTGAGTLSLSQTDLDAIANNAFAFIDIGSAAGTGTVTIGTASLRDPMRFRAGGVGGVIATSGVVTGTTADANLLFAGTTNSITNVGTLGTVTITGTNNTAGGVGGASIAITGAANNINGNLVTAGGTIGITGPVTLLANSLWDSTNAGAVAAGANITASSTIDGAFNLTFRAGTAGDIGVGGAIGSGTALGAITVVSVADTTADFDGAITASSFTQNAGSSNFDGLVTIGAGGISLTGETFTFNAGATTTGGGGVSITNNGLLTIANVAFNLDGAFSKLGAGATDLGANITTTNDAISFGGGTTTLTADVQLNTGAGLGNVTFNSALTGNQGLTITAGTGAVAFNAQVGATALTDLVVASSGSIASLSTITADGLVSFTSTGTVGLGGLVSAEDGFSSSGVNFTQLGGITTIDNAIAINHTGAVTNTGALDAGTAAITVAGATIAQNGSAAGGTYTATATGSIGIADDITAATIDIHAGTSGTGDLTFTAAGVDLAGTTIMLQAGDGTGGSGTTSLVDALTNAPTFRGLAGGSTSPTTFVHEQDADVTNALTATAGQFGDTPAGVDYTLCSNDGSVFITDGSKFAGALLTFCGLGTGGCVDFGADLSVGSLTVTSDWCVSANITLETTAGTLALLGAGDTFANTVTFRGPEIDFGNTIVGTGAIRLETLNAGDDILFAGAGVTGDLDLTATELGFFSDGFASITIGRSDGTGTIQSGGLFTALDPFIFRSPTGLIRLDHALSATGNGSFQFFGPTRLAAGIVTQSGTVDFFDTIEIAANVLIDTTDAGSFAGGQVSFGGAVDADSAGNDRDLQVDAGTADVFFSATVGASEALGSLTINASAIGLSGVITNGDQTYTGDVTLEDDLTTLAGGGVTVNGGTTLTNTIQITTNGTSDGDVTFNGAVDGDTLGPWGLTVDAGAGNVQFNGTVGAGDPLATLIVSANDITLFTVTTSGGQSYTSAGTLFLNGDLAGVGISVSGNTQLDTDVIITGSTFVNLAGTVNSATGLGRSLTINSPTTTLGGVVGGAAGGALGSLTTDAAGTTNLNGGAITVLNAITFADNIVLGANTTLASTTLGDVTFNGTVNTDGSARSLTVNTGGGTIVNGAVGGTAALANFTTDAAGFTRLGANVTTTAAQTYNDAVRLNANVVLNGASAAFASTVDSNDTITPRSLTITTTGATSFASDVGGSALLASLSVNATTIALRGVETNGNQAYTGTATLNGDLRVNNAGTLTITGNVLVAGASGLFTPGASGSDITITGTVNASGSPQALVINAREDTNNAGAGVFLQGNIGLGVGAGEFALSTLDVTGGAYTLQQVRTTGNQTYVGAGTLNGNLTISGVGAFDFDGDVVLGGNITIASTDGNILFQDDIDSDTTARTLTINVGGASRTLTFSGEVGGLRALNALTVTNPGAGVIAINGGRVRTTNDQVYNGRVLLGANTLIEVNDLTFGSTVDSSGANRSLTIDSTTVAAVGGVTRFNGIVGEGMRLLSLTTNADGTTRFGGNVRTTSGMTINDTLLIGADTVIDGGSGQMLFRNGINAASDASLPRLFLHTTFSSTASQQAIRVGASIGTTGIFRGVSINTGSGFVARTTPQKAATLVFADAFNLDGTINAATVAATDVFTIVAGNEGIRMGVNEKITVFGTLRLVGSGANNSQVSIPGEVRLGDITALGDIVVRADSIRFVARGGGTFFEKQVVGNAVAPNAPIFEVADAGRTDIVAGGSFDFVGTLNAADRDLVLFSNNLGLIQGGLASVGFSIRNFTEGTDGIAGGVNINLFRNPANTAQVFGLDLSSKGNPGTSIATSIAGAIPRDTETREVATPVTVGRALREPLQEMGVYVRDLKFEETVEFLVGWATYRDIPEDRLKPKYEVALNRLQAETVQAAVDAYRELMYAPVLGADGQPVLDESGQPQIAKRVEDIKYAIGEAWNAYSTTVDEPTGQGFRAYLEARTEGATAEEKDALVFLDAAREVCDRLDAMGLSPFETSIPKNRLIGEMLPAAMSEEQLKAAIYGNQLAMF